MKAAVPSQTEDVIDAVFLAPRHGLGAAVVGIAAHGDAGRGPMAADAPDQMPQNGADLDARRRLAGPQQHRHRLAAFHVVDVDGQEAAGVVMGVEQRQLLTPVHRIAGVVDVERDGLGRGGETATEHLDQRRRHAGRRRARGRVLQAAHRRLRAQSPATFRHPAHRQFEQWIAAQAVAIVGVFVAAGDGEHAEAQHLGHRVVDAIRIAPVAQAPGQMLGQAETALGLAQQQQAAVGRQQSAVETRRHLLAADGWKIEGKKGIVGHGGRGGFVARVEMCLNNNFLHEFNGLRHVRYPIPRAVVNNPG